MVNSQWTQTDIEKNERFKFQKYHLFEISSDNKESQLNALHVSKPQVVQASIWNINAPDNLKSAVVNNWKDNGEDKQFLEVNILDQNQIFSYFYFILNYYLILN